MMRKKKGMNDNFFDLIISMLFVFYKMKKKKKQNVLLRDSHESKEKIDKCNEIHKNKIK